MLKNLPAMQETWIPSVGQEDSLEKGMATHSSILTWRIPWTNEPGGLQPSGLHRVRHLFSCPVMSDSAAPWTAAGQASLSFTVSQSGLRFRSIESVMPASHLILCRPLLLPSSVFPSTRVFSKEAALHTESSWTLLSD